MKFKIKNVIRVNAILIQLKEKQPLGIKEQLLFVVFDCSDSRRKVSPKLFVFFQIFVFEVVTG